MAAILCSPHDDDFALFASWTCLRERPIVVIVFNGHAQGKRGLSITAEQRAKETEAACAILGRLVVVRLGLRDDDPTVTAERIRTRLASVILSLEGKQIFLPAHEEGGHEQHNLVADSLPDTMMGLPPVVRYLTYTREPCQKSTSNNEVPILKPEWIGLKLKALSSFESQFLPAAGCVEHFIGRSLREYYL